MQVPFLKNRKSVNAFDDSINDDLRAYPTRVIVAIHQYRNLRLT